MAECLWTPTEERVRHSNMTGFQNFVQKQCGQIFSDYPAFHRWSVEQLEMFWDLFLKYSGIRRSGTYSQVLNSQEMPGATWFPGLQLNYAENVLAGGQDELALLSVVESDSPGETSVRLTFAQLRAEVEKCATALLASGVGRGDVVAGYIANVSEAIIACLACAAIGAVWCSASPDFGFDALHDRLSQVQPKALFASTHYRYGGKIYRTDEVVAKIKKSLKSLRLTVSVPYPTGEAPPSADATWEAFLKLGHSGDFTFEQVPFDHPLFILFTSGTTGPPKCMVHGTGGTLLQHKKELSLHTDLKKQDRLLYFTTCGWMMWNWQLSALSLGSTICLFDGNPGFPDLSAIWSVVQQLGITHFGTSGRFLESCMKRQPPFVSGELGTFDHLKCVLYTGSPLSEYGFRWVYETVKTDVHLAGISGGTDIVSCFVLGNPNLPVYAGQIQCKGLGVDVTAFDENGNEILGKPGELVCRQPIPSMPVAFLNDPENEKYRAAYFDVYPGVWRHGDYIEFTPEGGAIIYGRSDATLNPGGVRIGSAEIYAALDGLDFINGAVVVGWRPPGESDESIILFVVLNAGVSLTEEMQKTIKGAIREKFSPRHVPRFIFQISSVPVTRSGKPVELSVKSVLMGRQVGNRNALANPEVLLEIEHIRDRLLQKNSGAPR